MSEPADEHDGAADRDRKPEDDGRSQLPSEGDPRERAQTGRGRDLPDRSRNRHPVDASEAPDTEVQAHPEHQQGHADLGELQRGARIRYESRRERPDRDAGQQVPHDRGEADQEHQLPGDERGAERDGDGSDEIRAVGLHENLPDVGASGYLASRIPLRTPRFCATASLILPTAIGAASFSSPLASRSAVLVSLVLPSTSSNP